jgi:hypothetical protein
VYSKPVKDRMDGFTLEQEVRINDPGSAHHGKPGLIKVLPRHPGSFFQVDVLPDGAAAVQAVAKKAKRGRDDDAAVVKNEYIRFRAKNLLDAAPPPPLLGPTPLTPGQDVYAVQAVSGIVVNGLVVDLMPPATAPILGASDANEIAAALNASILSDLMQSQAPVSLN